MEWVRVRFEEDGRDVFVDGVPAGKTNRTFQVQEGTHEIDLVPLLIVDAAKDLRADLIVMGTHGRTSVAHLLIGSVAEKVVRTASCPVLTE